MIQKIDTRALLDEVSGMFTHDAMEIILNRLNILVDEINTAVDLINEGKQ